MPRERLWTGSSARVAIAVASSSSAIRSRGLRRRVEARVEVEVLASGQLAVEQRLVAERGRCAPRTRAPRRGSSRPSTRTEPACGSRSVASTRSSVVLPAPLGPNTASVCARGSVSVDAGKGLALAEAAHQAGRPRSPARSRAGRRSVARPRWPPPRRQPSLPVVGVAPAGGTCSVGSCAAAPARGGARRRSRAAVSRMLFGLPGKLTISVRPRMPATARESIQ